MVWNVELTPTASKQLKKIDRKWQSEILDYLEDELVIVAVTIGHRKNVYNN